MKKVSEKVIVDNEHTLEKVYAYTDRSIYYEFFSEFWKLPKDVFVKLNMWNIHPWYREIERKKCQEQHLSHTFSPHTFNKMLSSFETQAENDIDLFTSDYKLYFNYTAQQAKEIVKNKDKIRSLFEELSQYKRTDDTKDNND